MKGNRLVTNMNLYKRAVLYNLRKWKKSLIILCLLFFIATLVQSGISIVNAQKKETEKLRGTTGASFTVERDISTGGWSSGSGGSYSTQEFMSEDMIQEIAALDGIAGYDASLIVHEDFYNEEGEALISETYGYYSYGSYNSEYNAMFLSGKFELVEGRHITEDMTNGLIISRELADLNKLEIGDVVTGIYYPENNTPAVDMEIVGIFDIVADKNDEIDMYNNSSYFSYANYTFCSMKAAEGLLEGWGSDGISEAYYYVADAAQLDNVINAAKSISSINWNNYKVIKNDEVYQNIEGSISDTGTLITTLIIVITIVSLLLLILILSMSMKSRKREIGILLAVGITKLVILIQYILEILLIAIVAFPLSYFFTKQIAGALGKLFEETTDSVIVTQQNFILVAIVGMILLIISVLVSCIPMMRFKPKEILAQME